MTIRGWLRASQRKTTWDVIREPPSTPEPYCWSNITSSIWPLCGQSIADLPALTWVHLLDFFSNHPVWKIEKLSYFATIVKSYLRPYGWELPICRAWCRAWLSGGCAEWGEKRQMGNKSELWKPWRQESTSICRLRERPPGVHCATTYGSCEEVFHVVHGCISHSLAETYRTHVGMFLMVPAASTRETGRSQSNMK